MNFRGEILLESCESHFGDTPNRRICIAHFRCDIVKEYDNININSDCTHHLNVVIYIYL